jgi:MFS family permease
MRFLLGLAEAGFFPGVILYLTYWFPRAQCARKTAAFMTAVAVSGIIGGPISGWILGRMAGVSGLAGWQWLFLLEGLPSVLLGLWVLLKLDDGPSRARWLDPEERALIQARLEEDERAKRGGGHGATSLTDAFRQRRVWLLCLVYFGTIMGLYGVSFWLPQIIMDAITTDPVAIGLISAIPWLAGVVAMLWTGHHSDVTGERRWHVALACLVGGAAFGATALPGVGGWLGLVALSVAVMGIMSAVACFWTLPTAILSGTAAAAGIAWINSVGNLGGYVSPFVIGRLRDLTHSMTPALVFLAISLCCSGLLTLVVARPTQRSDLV